MGSDSMRKAYIESTRRGGFGSTSVRIAPMTKVQEYEQPGPAHYQVKEKPFKARYQQPSSTFASLSNRLVEQPSVVKVSVVMMIVEGSATVWCNGNDFHYILMI